TGVRPPAEDEGRFKITGNSQDHGAFRAPGLRNLALRTGLQHTGRLSLDEVIDFYNRGGDFTTSPGFTAALVHPQNFTTQDKADLSRFLRFGLIDQRAANESAPLFDRPLLYSESARVPVLLGAGVAGPGGSVPQAIALEPPYLGNPRFTVALSDVPPGVNAVLAIDKSDLGTGPGIPASASFALREVTTSNDGAGHGFASVSITIPNDPALAGTTLFGRWYLKTGNAVSRAFRFTIFAPSPQPEEFRLLNAAGLSKGSVAPQSIVSGFGSGLSANTVGALPGTTPTLLGDVRVSITDRAGASFDAPLQFVSAGQINFLVPASVATGEATVRVLRNDIEVTHGRLQVATFAPAFFAANSDGREAASALVQRFPQSGASTTTGLVRFDPDLQRFVPQPITLGAATDQVFLLLFGTGIRGREGALAATIGGTPVEVLYAGPQGQFDGLDQVNLRLPRELAGRGEMDVIVTLGDRRANTVRIAVQ
ncbi:MAG: hypothetical protein ABI995_05000, partial [Acidobacteriota bacterium]